MAVAPVRTMLSPNTMITNSWKRSAKWPASISHSVIGVGPLRGSQYRISGAARSMPNAVNHSAQRAPPSANAPPIQSGADRMLHVRIC